MFHKDFMSPIVMNFTLKRQEDQRYIPKPKQHSLPRLTFCSLPRLSCLFAVAYYICAIKTLFNYAHADLLGIKPIRQFVEAKITAIILSSLPGSHD